MRHSGAANSYRHEYLTVRPNTLGPKGQQKNGPDIKDEKQSQVPLQEGVAAEDLFGDCDSDDEDPTVTSLLESRSLQTVRNEPSISSDRVVVVSGEETALSESLRLSGKRARDEG